MPVLLHVQGAATDRPVLHMGDCVFHGKHEFMIGEARIVI